MDTAMDFRAYVNARLPAWFPQPTTTAHDGKNTGLTMHGVPCGLREYAVNYPRDVELDGEGPPTVTSPVPASLSYMPFLRALDPAGNIVPLIVSDTREWDEDAMARADRTIASKRRAKWIILEDDHLTAQSPAGEEPWAWAHAQAVARKQAHGAAMYAQEQAHRSLLDKRQEAQQERMVQAMEAQAENSAAAASAIARELAAGNADLIALIMDKMGDKLAAALNSRGGKKGSGE